MDSAPTATRSRPTVQLIATLVASALTLLGIIGFLPGLTTNLYDGLELAGDDGDAKILGVFETSVLHNLVHLTFGVVGLAMARTRFGARTFLIGGGVIYLALWLLGFLGGLDWIPVSDADDWLHFVTGIAMIGLGYWTTSGGERAGAT